MANLSGSATRIGHKASKGHLKIAASGGDGLGAKPKAASERVALYGIDKQPTIDGKRKPVLTCAQYDAVRVLILAEGKGLTKTDLDVKSGHGDARKTLKRLADSDKEWKAVLRFPAKRGIGYRIL